MLPLEEEEPAAQLLACLKRSLRGSRSERLRIELSHRPVRSMAASRPGKSYVSPNNDRAANRGPVNAPSDANGSFGPGSRIYSLTSRGTGPLI